MNFKRSISCSVIYLTQAYLSTCHLSEFDWSSVSLPSSLKQILVTVLTLNLVCSSLAYHWSGLKILLTCPRSITLIYQPPCRTRKWKLSLCSRSKWSLAPRRISRRVALKWKGRFPSSWNLLLTTQTGSRWGSWKWHSGRCSWCLLPSHWQWTPLLTFRCRISPGHWFAAPGTCCL